MYFKLFRDNMLVRKGNTVLAIHRCTLYYFVQTIDRQFDQYFYEALVNERKIKT